MKNRSCFRIQPRVELSGGGIHSYEVHIPARTSEDTKHLVL
jgi:hypothetical protein